MSDKSYAPIESIDPGEDVSQTEREAFEAWYLRHFYMSDSQCGLEWLYTEPCGGYRHQHPKEQWIAWQAALDSVVVELPELSEYIDRYGQGESCDEYVTDVIGAIHAAGVRTK